MSIQLMECEQGWEPDMWSQNCSIPRSAHVIHGACWLLVGSIFLTSELFLRTSSQKSFAGMDREKQVIILLRALSAASGMLLFGPLAYDREWDDSSFRMKAALFMVSSSFIWLIINSYRGMHNGISTAFALRRDLSQVLRNLSGAKTVHVAIFVVLNARVVWNVTGQRSDTARLALAQTWYCGTAIPLALMFGFAAMLASSALRELPDTNQTVQIRRKVQSFKRTMIYHCLLCLFVVLVMVLFSSLLLEYQLFCGACVFLLCGVVPGLSINLAKLLPHNTKHSKKRSNTSKPRTVQIVPALSTSSKLLIEWAQEGKQSDDPYTTNLQPDVQTVGVLGVSLALLKKLAEENDVPADWTMAQVCADVVKPQTLFQLQTKYNTKQDREVLDPLPGRKQIHCAYAALIGMAVDDEGRPYVGKATRFLSYAWKYSWKVVFTALELFEQQQAEAGEEPSYFFIDQLCLDQHEMSSTAHDATDEKYKEIVAKLQKSIEVPGKVLMLLHPWNQPVVLSRAW
jgi:hypothetical protein